MTSLRLDLIDYDLLELTQESPFADSVRPVYAAQLLTSRMPPAQYYRPSVITNALTHVS